MIRYMLVILCKWTMWCFNKLSKTQWVRGYPVGLQQGTALRVHVRACACVHVLLNETGKLSDDHQLTFLNWVVETFICHRWMKEVMLSLDVTEEQRTTTTTTTTVPWLKPSLCVLCLYYDCFLFDHRRCKLWSNQHPVVWRSGGVRWSQVGSGRVR